MIWCEVILPPTVRLEASRNWLTLCNGYTRLEAHGGWVSDTGSVHEEKMDLWRLAIPLRGIPAVVDAAKGIARRAGEQAVLYSVDGAVRIVQL